MEFVRLRTLLPLVFAVTLLGGCEADEYAVLISAESAEPMRSVDVVVTDREGGSRFRSGLRPIVRMSRDGGMGEPARIVVRLDAPRDVVVHLVARDMDDDAYGAVRCYSVRGVVEDSVMLVRLDPTLDGDADGFAQSARAACFAAGGGRCADTVACPGEVGGDCNDDAPSVHPGAREICADAVDQDCDGLDAQCEDRDGDGYNACSQTDDPRRCDCDDGVASVHPGAPESASDSGQCADGVDQNCDGFDALCDRDGDLFPADRARGGHPDCDDENPAVNPAALEACTCAPGEACNADPVDEDCDGLFDELPECTTADLDLDGYDACEVAAPGTTCDCNDCDAGVHPEGREVCSNGFDEDCDRQRVDLACVEGDSDHDGWVAREAGGTDCDDDDPRTYPAAPEICATPISESCGELSCDDDLDHDGIVEIPGCETGAMQRPYELAETCNGRDDDCDGTTDETLVAGRGCVFNDPRNPACDRQHCVVDFQTDVLHCGRCRAACNPDRFVADRCVAGQCDCNGDVSVGACNGGSTCCPDGCKDLRVDFTHCGNCDNVCGEDADSCRAGRCQCGDGPACGPGYLCCGGRCIDPSVTTSHCGRCGNECGPNQFCGSGTCRCSDDFLDCDGEQSTGCEIDPDISLQNCGTCGNACGDRQECKAGRCECVDQYLDCDGTQFPNGCEIDPLTSTAHCGRCNNACGPNQTCGAGTCACVAPFDDCTSGAGCETDLTQSVSHCGRCGDACSYPFAAPVCSGSRCSMGACNDGRRDCNGTSSDGCETDVTTVTNCVTCGTRCGASETCSTVGCRCGGSAGCTGANTCCPSGCRNLQDDEANCGGCGIACGPGEQCINMRCACGGSGATPGGGRYCPVECCGATSCIDTQNDDANCGSCGNVCGPNERCMGGSCHCGAGPRCTPGFTCCGGTTCADLQNDPENCNACGDRCPGMQMCIGGLCMN